MIGFSFGACRLASTSLASASTISLPVMVILISKSTRAPFSGWWALTAERSGHQDIRGAFKVEAQRLQGRVVQQLRVAGCIYPL